MLALADTAAMPLWTGDGPPPEGQYTWQSYTALGPYVPAWSRPVSLDTRRAHSARHNVKPRSLRRWIASVARELGNFFVGDFQYSAA